MREYLIFKDLDALKRSVILNRVGKIQVNSVWVCIVWDGDQLYAFDEHCPHQNYSLAGSICKNGNVVCPLHQYQFNLENMKGHGLSLQSYKVLKRNEAYYIVI